MAPEASGLGVGAFGVNRVVFAVGAMFRTARRLLRKRLGSELETVRGLIRKVEFEEETQQQQFPTLTPTARPITRSPPAPSVLPKESDIFARPLESATDEAMQKAKAKPEGRQNQCAAPTPALRPVISTSPPAPLAVPRENDTSARPQTPAVVHIVEPDELQTPRPVVTAPTEPPINSSPLAPAARPNQNDTSAPDAAHTVIVESQDPSSPVADDPLTDLIAKAQETMEQRRQEEGRRTREEARRGGSSLRWRGSRCPTSTYTRGTWSGSAEGEQRPPRRAWLPHRHAVLGTLPKANGGGEEQEDVDVEERERFGRKLGAMQIASLVLCTPDPPLEIRISRLLHYALKPMILGSQHFACMLN
jgi:hypothetical protein